jgi:hypothetical protein
MQKRYKVTLSSDERHELIPLISRVKSNAQKIKHANILLAINEVEHGKISDTDAAKQCHCHPRTIANIRERFVLERFHASLERKKQTTPSHPRTFDGSAEPLGNWHRVSVRSRRTQCDWAEEIAHLLDVDFPDAERVVLVMDNLNTHKISSLYERLEIHDTPKHGSWLNMSEIELSLLTVQSAGRC